MENQILLEKIGETKTQKLIEDCDKIFMEQFRKEFPNYFETNYLKSIAKVVVTKPKSTEIKGIGMSCINDLMTKQFAQWLGAMLGNQRTTSGGNPKRTTGATVSTFGASHGGSTGSMWGRIPTPTATARGLKIAVGNSLIPPTKLDFNQVGNILGLVVNAGTFNSGLNTVSWTAQNTALSDFTISSSNVISQWSIPEFGSGEWLLLNDLISPTSNVVNGESIFLAYTFQFA